MAHDLRTRSEYRAFKELPLARRHEIFLDFLKEQIAEWGDQFDIYDGLQFWRYLLKTGPGEIPNVQAFDFSYSALRVHPHFYSMSMWPDELQDRMDNAHDDKEIEDTMLAAFQYYVEYLHEHGLTYNDRPVSMKGTVL